MMEIRYITPSDDRLAVSRVYEESWKHAYRGIIPQDYLDSIPEGRWAANIDCPGWKTLVCVDSGQIVGASSFCSSRLAEFAGWGEIVSLYLLPAHMGKGYGKALLEAAVRELNRMGYASLFLWVLEENQRARRFYERAGFAPSGGYLDDTIGGRDLREVRYVYSPPGSRRTAEEAAS